MGIGASVFMLAAGAIIAFAFNLRVGWLDLDIVGWVLMAVGAFGVILTLTMMNRRRTVVTTNQVAPSQVQPPVPGRQVVEERAPYEVDRPV